MTAFAMYDSGDFCVLSLFSVVYAINDDDDDLSMLSVGEIKNV